MCTVTYIPTKRGFIFTSNRDENPGRVTTYPAYYQNNKATFFGPKDKLAGGTWIGVSSQKRLVCLLNGGLAYHKPKIKFAKSRGAVVTFVLAAKNIKTALNTMNLKETAPFTLLILDWENQYKIYEFIWCGGKKQLRTLNTEQSYIWSSSTLYTDEMKIERKAWFFKMLASQLNLTKNKVLDFHQNEHLGTATTAPKMKRELVATVSTTMVVKNNESVSMNYHDYVLGNNFEYENLFDFLNV